MDKYSYPSYPFVVRYEVGRSAKHKRKGEEILEIVVSGFTVCIITPYFSSMCVL